MQAVFGNTSVLTFLRLWTQSFCSGKLYKEEPGRIPTEQGKYQCHSSYWTAHLIATDFSGDTLIQSTRTFLHLCTDTMMMWRSVRPLLQPPLAGLGISEVTVGGLFALRVHEIFLFFFSLYSSIIPIFKLSVVCVFTVLLCVPYLFRQCPMWKSPNL